MTDATHRPPPARRTLRAFTTAGLSWHDRWCVLRKRLPSLTAAATIIVAAGADANVVAAIPERFHPWLRVVLAGATGVLLWTRSIAPGAHGADYEVGLVPDRRGTGTRTGELPTTAAPAASAPHGVADAGTHADDGTLL